MKTGILLSVREKATRLPKKVLADIHGRSVTEHLIARLRTSERADMLVLATSTHPDDVVLVEIAEAEGIASFRGSEDDKLDRYLRAAEHFGLDAIVVADGDDIFCDPAYVDRIIERMEATGADFCTTEGLPLGCAGFGVNVEALRRVVESKKEHDTEVWGGYFTKDPRFHVEYVQADDDVFGPDFRLTLDYAADLEVIRALFDALDTPRGRIFGLDEIVAFLRSHPELAQSNAHAQKLYEENLKRIKREATGRG